MTEVADRYNHTLVASLGGLDSSLLEVSGLLRDRVPPRADTDEQMDVDQWRSLITAEAGESGERRSSLAAVNDAHVLRRGEHEIEYQITALNV